MLVDARWLSVKRTDERAFALYRRHYSAAKGARWRRPGNTNVTSAGETMVLLTQCERALFVWLHTTIERHDKQRGVNCAVFRNEGAGLSSELIREADELAWQRWPQERRHFTYVDGGKTSRRRSRLATAGRCFEHAGWRTCGASQTGLTLLEVVG